LLVNKLSKTKKRLSTNLEIFRIREKSIPVDIVTVEDNVRGFFWETKGNRFAILTADEAGIKPKMFIYQLGREKCEALCCFDLPSNSFNKVIWAPEGQYFVVASVSSTSGASGSGDLLFAGMTPDNKLEILHKDEHYMLTNVEWDPSSRYVITAVTQPMSNETGYKYSMEAGYAIWTFQGRVLYRQQKEKLYHVAWRPHPPSLLPANKQKDIRKNIRQFSKKYDAMDEQAKETARQAFRREREEKTNAFLDILDRLKGFKQDKMDENNWQEAMDDFAEAQGWAQDEQIIEEELGVTEELISG
jgi:translation initiation factor 3 subunit B